MIRSIWDTPALITAHRDTTNSVDAGVSQVVQNVMQYLHIEEVTPCPRDSLLEQRYGGEYRAWCRHHAIGSRNWAPFARYCLAQGKADKTAKICHQLILLDKDHKHVEPVLLRAAAHWVIASVDPSRTEVCQRFAHMDVQWAAHFGLSAFAATAIVATVLRQIGLTPLAQAVFCTVHPTAEDTTVCLDYAEAALEEGDYGASRQALDAVDDLTAAARWIDQRASASPSLPLLGVMRATLQATSGQRALAQHWLTDEVRLKKGTHVDSTMLTAWLGIATTLGQAPLLREIDASARCSGPQSRDFYQDLAKAFVTSGDTASAVEVLEQSPVEDSSLLLQCAQLLVQTGEVSRADTLLRKQCCAAGDNVGLLELCYDVLKLQNKMADALKVAEKLAVLQPHRLDWHSACGRLHLQMHRPREAIPCLQRALKLHDKSLTVLRLLVSACQGSDSRFDVCEKALLAILAMDVTDFAAAVRLGGIRDKMRRRSPDSSAAAYQIALGRNPQDINAWIGLGKVRVGVLRRLAKKQPLPPTLQIAYERCVQVREECDLQSLSTELHRKHLEDLEKVIGEVQSLPAVAKLAPGQSTPPAAATPQPRDPAFVSFWSGGRLLQGTLVGKAFNGVARVRCQGRTYSAPWTPELLGAWRSMPQDPLRNIAAAQVHSNLGALADELDAVLELQGSATKTPRQIGEALCAYADEREDDGTPHVYYMGGSKVYDLVGRYYGKAPPSLLPRDSDVDLIVTFHSALVCCGAIQAIPYEIKGRCGPHGMGSPITSMYRGNVTFAGIGLPGPSIDVSGAAIKIDGNKSRDAFDETLFITDLAELGKRRLLNVLALLYCPRTRSLIELAPDALEDVKQWRMRHIDKLSTSSPMLMISAAKGAARGMSMDDVECTVLRERIESLMGDPAQLGCTLARARPLGLQSPHELETWLQEFLVQMTKLKCAHIFKQNISLVRERLLEGYRYGSH